MYSLARIFSREGIAQEVRRVEGEFAELLSLDCAIGDYGRATPHSEAFNLVSDWCGFGGVTRLADSTGLDRIGLPNWYAVRPSALCPTAIIASGKGPSRQLAILSALYEAFERWAAESSAGAVISASVDQLKQLFPDLSIVPPLNWPV